VLAKNFCALAWRKSVAALGVFRSSIINRKS
jgi:hypothetical protein